jgi:hypothetical protein
MAGTKRALTSLESSIDEDMAVSFVDSDRWLAFLGCQESSGATWAGLDLLARV